MKTRLLCAVVIALWAGRVPAADDAGMELLTLARAHEIALQNHPGIAAAKYQAQAAENVVTETRAGSLPQVMLYGSAVNAGSDNTRILAGGLNNPSVFDRRAIGAGVSQLITDFGRTPNLVASSRLQAAAANETAAATAAQVLLDVDRNYFTVLQAQALQQVAQQTVDTRQLLLDRVTVLAANKLKSDLDVSFARVALAEGTLLLQSARNNLESSRAALSAALGFREMKQFRLVDEAPPTATVAADLDKLIESALHNRPELASLADQRDSALRLARAQRDARFPTLSVGLVAGDALTHDARLPDNYSAGGLQVSVPLFAGGFYAARQREAELRAKAAEQGLAGAEDTVARDVRIAWLAVNDALQRVQTTQQLRDYAAQAYELAQARYNAGSSSIVELSQAQLALSSAEIANAGARYNLLIQQANLKYQSGDTATELRNTGLTGP
ncbi:MAG TPA: TolC family protein [Gammaproteobacteria bacterium]|nr:TolC family protein [Gammaproteobacteria bacterium]